MNNNKILFAILAVTLVLGMASCDLLGGGGGGGSTTPTTPTTPTPPTSVPVTGVSLKSAASLAVGGTETLTAEIEPSNATNQNVTWSSGNTSVATVSAGGLVTAVAPGTATITVKTQDSNKTASCTVTVSSIPVSGVSLKSTTSLIVGGTETLVPTITPPNAANQNVTWDSNNTGVATVSANGIVTAVAAGTATITVKTADGNKTAACSVSVVTSAVPVTGVSLNKSSTSLNVGSSESLSATISPSTATNQNVTWTSSNTSIATVSAGGLVTAVAVGTATITVKTVDGDKTASCTVTVNPIPVSGVSLKPSTSLDVGGTETLYATITPSNATNQNVTWASSNASTATVSAGGLVTGVAAGTATITVTTVDGSKTATCNVTVSAPAPAIPTFTTISAFKAWLDAQASNTKTTAYNVALNVSDLGSDSYTSGSAGKALRDNLNKYVNLDLTGSTFTSIGGIAISSCHNLTGITIPDSVTTIWGRAFGNCTSLTSVTFQGTIASNNLAIDTFGYSQDSIGDLRDKYLAGGPGTYTRPNTGYGGTWTKQAVFVEVTGITDVPTSGTAGTSLALTGTVAPANATNKTIVWSVKSAGATGATISGNTLSTTASGTVTVTATIANGLTASTAYTQEFTITITSAFVAVKAISGVPTSATAGTPLALTGTVAPANATNKTIVWTVKDARATGATISGNTLSAIASGLGYVTVTATIANGKYAVHPRLLY
jgi:uncharacterized protein YjdB